MAIVVRNDAGHALQVKGGGNVTRIEPGEIRVLSDDEWTAVSWQNRGPGKLVSISPDENSSESLKIKMDYYQPGATNEIHFIGYAEQAALDTDPVWTIRKHLHGPVGAEYLLIEIQVLTGVAWADRTTLPWT